MNTFRGAGAILGTLLAVALMRPLTEAFGGGARGLRRGGRRARRSGSSLPWPFVHRASFERAGLPGARPRAGFLRSIGSLAQARAYLRLTGLFLLGRIAIDLASTHRSSTTSPTGSGAPTTS